MSDNTDPTIVDPAPVEETPAADPAAAPVEETPAAEPAPVEETPAADPSAAPVEETPSAEPAPVEETPAAEPAPVEETPATDPAPVEETPAADPAPVEETPAAEPAAAAVEETPAAEPAAPVLLTLAELVNNGATDINTGHSYLEVYEQLFSPRRNDTVDILQIGINAGGTAKLWADYFPNANLNIFDPFPRHYFSGYPFDLARTNTQADINPYDPWVIQSQCDNKQFDFIIDDCSPRSLEVMKTVVIEYSKYLKSGGILIIEDIQDVNWETELRNVTPVELQASAQLIDRRNVKDRYDDILFVITKP